MVKNKKDNTRDRILSASRKVFQSRGMAGARMQDIADEAGINKALLHYYFSNKEKLFEVIFNDAFSQFFPKIINAIDADISLDEKIRYFCREYIDLMLQNPFLPLFVLYELNNQPERFAKKMWNNRQSPFQLFVLQVEKEIKNKNIRPVNPANLFMNMLSMLIFPFVAKPLWMAASGMDENTFRKFMEERKTSIPKFIIESLNK
jgi:TetR/AcrR family transcriptional regulator